MPIVAKAGSSREPAPVGNHVAICYQIIDIGTIETTWEGKTKQVHKCRISFELVHELKKENDVEKPLVVSIPRTLSLGKQARMRAELESWRGKPFTEEEAKGFDITKLLGVPCMINIIHTEEGYERVHAITPVPKGVTIPKQFNPNIVLAYDSWNQEFFDSLPDFIKEQMKGSAEYAFMTKGEGPKDSDADRLTDEQKDILQHEEEKKKEDPLPF